MLSIYPCILVLQLLQSQDHFCLLRRGLSNFVIFHLSMDQLKVVLRSLTAVQWRRHTRNDVVVPKVAACLHHVPLVFWVSIDGVRSELVARKDVHNNHPLVDACDCHVPGALGEVIRRNTCVALALLPPTVVGTRSFYFQPEFGLGAVDARDVAVRAGQHPLFHKGVANGHLFTPFHHVLAPNLFLIPLGDGVFKQSSSLHCSRLRVGLHHAHLGKPRVHCAVPG
mmetsp:Transcript_19743/g.37626  ORF Transcript_19743/g.37626 Transcript_19743/m.37626 type:complete len:225 (+) Transcript_19743:382-1056(+)